jgi:thioredoxin 1
MRPNSRAYAFKVVEAGEFDSTVIQSKVPVIVDFSADWCGPCKLMLPIFKSLADEYPEESVKLVKVDTDVHEDVVDKYNIQGVPLFGVFKNGEMVASHSGALTKDKLKEFINKNT